MVKVFSDTLRGELQSSWQPLKVGPIGQWRYEGTVYGLACRFEIDADDVRQTIEAMGVEITGDGKVYLTRQQFDLVERFAAEQAEV